jgi:hypothetical protein
LDFLNAFGHDAAKSRRTGGLPPADAFGVRLMQLRNRSGARGFGRADSPREEGA